jgi:hypothetical protein
MSLSSLTSNIKPHSRADTQRFQRQLTAGDLHPRGILKKYSGEKAAGNLTANNAEALRVALQIATRKPPMRTIQEKT